TVLVGANQVQELLSRKRDFLCTLQARVLAEADSASSIQEITRRVFHPKDLVDRLSFSDGWLSLLTGSDFSRGNLVKSFLRDNRQLNPGQQSPIHSEPPVESSM
ncbi:MAG: hypothetical protein ACRCZF_13285, partial [Gemmataceae bacterium]